MIRCIDCGKFISYKSIDEQKATCYYEPLNEFGPERIEWTCEECNERPRGRDI